MCYLAFHDKITLNFDPWVWNITTQRRGFSYYSSACGRDDKRSRHYDTVLNSTVICKRSRALAELMMLSLLRNESNDCSGFSWFFYLNEIKVGSDDRMDCIIKKKVILRFCVQDVRNVCDRDKT